MHPGVLDLGGRVAFVPVRHHSPACARAVRWAAESLRPAAVLIEGPADFTGRIGELALPHALPIAIYSYVRLPDGQRRGAFYPFCEHSPEWEALRAARGLGAEARFIDVPWAELAGAGLPAHRYADGELRESPYVPTLCRRLGVEDFDGLWDRLVEVDGALPPAEVVARAQRLCYHIRAASPRVAAQDLRREAFMLAQIRAALADHAGPLLVVTGGFHSYALYAALSGLPPPEAPAARPPEPWAEAAAGDVERGISLTPYADARLDGLAGYEAGMPSPGFYRRVWRDRQAGRGETYRALLAEAAAALRGRGQAVSTADLIAVEAGARGLAALRGHAEVWRQDLVDAVIGGLVKEAVEAGGPRHPLLDALLAVLRGGERGRLAEGASLPPLVHDIRRELREHGLEPEQRERQVRLDLAAPADLARSRVLHRLRGLGLRGFDRTAGTDLVGRGDLAALWERWRIVWTPELEADCIEASIYGATLADAAAALLAERAGADERSAERAALLLLEACLMGLGPRADELAARLAALVREDGDLASVGAALGHLLYLYRFDDALGAAGRGDVGALLAEAYRRALWLLETLGQAPDAAQPLLGALRSVARAFESCGAALALDRETLVEVLARVAADAGQGPLLRGAASGALWSLGEADEARVRADLRSCAAPERLGDFLTGLFTLAREPAQRHPGLVLAVDSLLVGYGDEEFLHALPALRLAFSLFSPREKHHIARTLVEAVGGPAEPLPALEVPLRVAARAMALEGWALAELERYGLRLGGGAP